MNMLGGEYDVMNYILYYIYRANLFIIVVSDVPRGGRDWIKALQRASLTSTFLRLIH